YNEHTYILRQNKAVHYEAPFMFLLFGRSRANGLALGDHPGFEQVEADLSGDGGDGWLFWLAGGEVAGFLGLAGAGAVWAVADGGAGQDDLQEEGGEGQVSLLRGGKPRRCPSRRRVRAGS